METTNNSQAVSLSSTPKRILQVYHSSTARLITLETDAIHWSKVIPLLQAEGIDMKNLKAVVGSTKGTLELPDALIPAGNQQIILTPSKMNSGAVDKDFTELGYNDLRRKAKELNITGLGSNPSKNDLIVSIKKATGLDQKVAKKAEKLARVEKVKTIVKETKDLTPSLEERVSQLEQILGKMIFANHKVWVDFLPKPKIFQEVSSQTTGLLSEEAIAELAASLTK